MIDSCNTSSLTLRMVAFDIGYLLGSTVKVSSFKFLFQLCFNIRGFSLERIRGETIVECTINSN